MKLLPCSVGLFSVADDEIIEVSRLQILTAEVSLLEVYIYFAYIDASISCEIHGYGFDSMR